MKKEINERLSFLFWSIITATFGILFVWASLYWIIWSCVNSYGTEWRQKHGHNEVNFMGIEYPNKVHYNDVNKTKK